MAYSRGLSVQATREAKTDRNARTMRAIESALSARRPRYDAWLTRRDGSVGNLLGLVDNGVCRRWATGLDINSTEVND